MAVISITILESEEEIISGIPRFLTVSTNITSVIFYTFDGSDPTINSDIYLDKLQVPEGNNIVFKVYATNGSDSSPIITSNYDTKYKAVPRMSHDGTTDSTNINTVDPYPFGTSPITPIQEFIPAADVNYVDYNPAITSYPTGYDSSGIEDGYTNYLSKGIPEPNYPVVFSDSNAEGETGSNIGTLPPKANVIPEPPPPEMANSSDKLFDPRALVIYQDFTKVNDPDSPVEINRQFYNTANESHNKTGALYFNNVDQSPPTGAFLRQHFNPKDNTMTYYYFNSSNNSWIISKTSYKPSENAGHYYDLVFARNQGVGFIFKWIPFKGNHLF